MPSAGSRQAEAREELRHHRQMVEFPPAALDQLPSPVNPDEQQEGTLQPADHFEKLIVKADSPVQQVSHDGSTLLASEKFYETAARLSGLQNQPSAAQFWNQL